MRRYAGFTAAEKTSMESKWLIMPNGRFRAAAIPLHGAGRVE
jgi:hypothetical protein